MKKCFLKVVVLFIFLLSSTQVFYSWDPVTHEMHLTSEAIKLVLKEHKDAFGTELKKYQSLIRQGAHDEDYPIRKPVIVQMPYPYNLLVGHRITAYLRANNHYRHAISGKVLSYAPIITKNDPDVDALTWAKTNPKFSKAEEYGDEQWWAIKNKIFTIQELNHGNMSWQCAVNRFGYTDHSKRLSYYTLGFILHLLQDMGVPEHVHDDPHGGSSYTGFEKWVKENWEYLKNNFVPKIGSLKPKRFGKNESIDMFFDNLAKIAYSADRFSANFSKKDASGNPMIDPSCNLAKMFKVVFDWWYKDKYQLLPYQDQVDDSKIARGYYNWYPERFRKNPFSHTGGQGSWWPTHQEIQGGANDVAGYYYIELSDEFPPIIPFLGDLFVSWERPLYAKAYLPTPLRSVADQCKGWEVQKCDKGTHLYGLIGARMFPKAIEHSAGLIEHFYEIVNHPPYIKKVKVSQGSNEYIASWTDLPQLKSEKSKQVKNERKKVEKRRLDVIKDDCLDAGIATVAVEFSESVRDVQVKFGSQIQDASTIEKSGDKIWHAEFKIDTEGLQQQEERITVSVKARDKDNHYADEGDELDSKPETPAQRKCYGSNILTYRWEGYETGFDSHYEVKMEKDFSLTVHVQDEEREPIQGARVKVEFNKSKEQKIDREELQKKILGVKTEKKLTAKDRKQLVDLARSPEDKRATTDEAGDAQIKVMAGWETKVQAAAKGYKVASATKRIDSPSSRITLTLKADAAGDKIFFLWYFHTEEKLLRMYGPHVNLFMPPWEGGNPKVGTGYHLQLCYVNAGQAKAWKEQLKKKGDSKANLPIHDLLRYGNLQYIYANVQANYYKETYTVAIECNGQTRYWHTVYHEDLRKPGGDLSPNHWGGGRHFGLSPGEKEAKVTVFNAGGEKMAEFPIKFVIERDPDIDFSKKRKTMDETRKNIQEYRTELSKAVKISEKERWSNNLSAGLYVLLKFAHKYLEGSPGQLMSQFDQCLKAWENWLKFRMQTGEEASYALGNISDICSKLGTPQAFAAYERALNLVEKNAKVLGVSSRLAGYHSSAASLAIVSSNNIQAARRHLEQMLKWMKTNGEKVDEEKARKAWPKIKKGDDKSSSKSNQSSKK